MKERQQVKRTENVIYGSCQDRKPYILNSMTIQLAGRRQLLGSIRGLPGGLSRRGCWCPPRPPRHSPFLRMLTVSSDWSSWDSPPQGFSLAVWAGLALRQMWGEKLLRKKFPWEQPTASDPWMLVVEHPSSSASGGRIALRCVPHSCPKAQTQNQPLPTAVLCFLAHPAVASSPFLSQFPMPL